jgi:signal peptidase I
LARKRKRFYNPEVFVMNDDKIGTAVKAEETEKRTPRQSAYDWIEIIGISLAAVLVFLTFFARITTVVGDSMLPTLHEGERLFVICAGYEPEKGDIVVVQDDKSIIDYPIVKRIIATGGDTVEFDFANWLVYVNGEQLEEDYINKFEYESMRSYGCAGKVTVPEGYVFVMGDNRNGSTDSRDSRLGFVSNDDVIGKVAFRIAPINKFGKVN